MIARIPLSGKQLATMNLRPDICKKSGAQINGRDRRPTTSRCALRVPRGVAYPGLRSFLACVSSIIACQYRARNGGLFMLSRMYERSARERSSTAVIISSR